MKHKSHAPAICAILLCAAALAAVVTDGDALPEAHAAGAAHASETAPARFSTAHAPLALDANDADELYKKCGFDSDCKHGKCKSGKCGGCGFDSDCKGWGKCKSGACGACGFDSDCKGFGKCKSGRCSESPS